MNWLLDWFRTRKTRQRRLADRYERVSTTYALMAASSQVPKPSDVPWEKHCRWMRDTYLNHADDVRKL